MSTIDPYIPQQFAYAKTEGWLPFFAKSGADYDFEPALLMAIASRETNMRNIIGDGGHGYSLVQIDVRSFPDWCHSGAWHNVASAIDMGAHVLDGKRTQIGHGVGQAFAIGGQHFIGAHFPTTADLIHVSVACYNAGLWPYYSFSNGQDPDRFTTGHNYSADVLHRRDLFAALLAKEAA